MISFFRKIRLKLPFRKYIVGRDTFIRHRCAAYLLDGLKPATILDVGGEGLLNLFVTKAEIKTANIKEADIKLTCLKLPCPDNSFDAVVSIDTLEHINRVDRDLFLTEIYRVARYGFVLCAPLGTEAHIRHLKVLLKNTNIDLEVYRYLEEHLRFGLPTPDDVAELSKKFNGKVYYQGTYEKGYRPVHRLMGYPMLLVFTLQNLFSDNFVSIDRVISLTYQSNTNRFFIVVKK